MMAIALIVLIGVFFALLLAPKMVEPPVFAFACDTCDLTFNFDNEIDGYEWFVGHLSRHGIIITPECSPIE